MTSILNPFYDAIAWLIVHIHDGVAHVFTPSSGASWVISIVLLTLAMRIILIPLFVKQIKSQRAMTALQPQIKALQAKYKNDKNKLNDEMMKLWREAGVNPFMGCLPLLPQIPIFFALFHTLDKLKPTECTPALHCVAGPGHPYVVNVSGQLYTYLPFNEFSQSLVKSAATSKVFGVPIAASFNSSSQVVHALQSSVSGTRILCAVLTVLMVATTFLTQRQMMARNAATSDTPMPGQQKAILYVLPLIFLLYGYRFPVGVLFYWLTTNVWSLAQQFLVIRRMDMSAAVAAVSPSGPSGPAPGAKPLRPKPSTPQIPPSAQALPADGASPPPPPTVQRSATPNSARQRSAAQNNNRRRNRKKRR